MSKLIPCGNKDCKGSLIDGGHCHLCGWPRAELPKEAPNPRKQNNVRREHEAIRGAGGCVDYYPDCLTCPFTPQCVHEMKGNAKGQVDLVSKELKRLGLDWVDVSNYIIDTRGRQIKDRLLYASTEKMLTLLKTIASWKKNAITNGRWVWIKKE